MGAKCCVPSIEKMTTATTGARIAAENTNNRHCWRKRVENKGHGGDNNQGVFYDVIRAEMGGSLAHMYVVLNEEICLQAFRIFAYLNSQKLYALLHLWEHVHQLNKVGEEGGGVLCDPEK